MGLTFEKKICSPPQTDFNEVTDVMFPQRYKVCTAINFLAAEKTLN